MGKAKLICQQSDKISQQPENWDTTMALTWYRLFQRNGGSNQIIRRQTSRFDYSLKVPVVTITAFLTILGQIRGQKLITLATLTASPLSKSYY
jgi:hypothetical protein